MRNLTFDTSKCQQTGLMNLFSSYFLRRCLEKRLNPEVHSERTNPALDVTTQRSQNFWEVHVRLWRSAPHRALLLLHSYAAAATENITQA